MATDVEWICFPDLLLDFIPGGVANGKVYFFAPIPKTIVSVDFKWYRGAYRRIVTEVDFYGDDFKYYALDVSGMELVTKTEKDVLDFTKESLYDREWGARGSLHSKTELDILLVPYLRDLLDRFADKKYYQAFRNAYYIG